MVSARRRATRVRVLAAVVTLLVGVAVTEVVVRIETTQAENRATDQAAAVREVAAEHLVTGPEPTFFLTHALEAFVRGHGGNPEEQEVQPFMALIGEEARLIRSISLAPGNRIKYIEPLAGNEQALGLYFPDQTEQWPAVKRIIDGGVPVLVGPFDLVQGGQGLAYRLPISVDGEYWGLASTVIDATTYFDEALAPAAGTGATIGIRVAGAEPGAVLAGSPAAFGAGSTVQDVNVLGVPWQVGTVPVPVDGAAAAVIRTLGYSISLLLAALVYLLIGASQRRREAAQRLALLSDQVPGVLYQLAVETDGAISMPFVSDRLEALFGVSPESVTKDASSIWLLFEPEDAQRAQRAMEASARSGEPFHERLRGRTADGDVRWFLSAATPLRQADGSVIWNGVLSDVTAEVVTEEQLRVSASVFASTRDAVVISDPQGRATDVNPAFTVLTGFSRAEVLGRTLEMLAAGVTPAEVFDDVRASLERHGFWRGEISSRTKDGNVLSQAASMSAVLDDEGQLSHLVTVLAGLDSLREDFVTGLPSRQVLDDRLTMAVDSSAQNARPVALLVIGLDDFRDVNENLGHRVGDAVLREAALRLRGVVSDHGTVARVGGDEFAVLIEPTTGAAGIDDVAAQCLRVLAEPFPHADSPIHLSAGIGIAVCPDDADSASQLLSHANQALRVAKDQGKNLARYFTTSMQSDAMERAAIAEDLRRALAEDQLSLVFQPVVDLVTGLTTKIEALIRWSHPVRGPVSPAVFIPIAERSGLIRPIGDLVFAESLRLLARAREVVPTLALGFNMSPVELHDDSGRHDERLQVLARSGVPGNALIVEITEGLVVAQDDATLANIARYRDVGARFAIDDFGTGYSSLSYLQRIDVDYVKIDRAFVNGLPDESSDRALCAAIVAMAHGLQMEVIAEGIETPAQRDALSRMGCDMGQGYFFARPMPADELIEYLRREHTV